MSKLGIFSEVSTPSLNIADHPDSIVIWLADMNYRIDLDNDTVRALATSDQLDALVAADQVWGVDQSIVCIDELLVFAAQTSHGRPTSFSWI